MLQYHRACNGRSLFLPIYRDVARVCWVRERSARLGDDADVGLGFLPVAVDLLGLVVGDRAGDDDVLALLPVDRGGNPMRGRELQRVDDPQHLVEIPTCR